MLTMQVALRGSRRRWAPSLPSQIARSLSLVEFESSFRIEEASFRATELNSNNASAGCVVRFLSTSPQRRSNDRTNHRTSFQNRGKQNRISARQVHELMDESRGFLKIYKTMDASHRASKLQQLLVSWGPVVKFLNDDPAQLRQAVKYADSLANIFLDMTEEATNADSSSRSRAGASTFVNPAIHGWAKIQRIDSHSDAALRAEHLLKRLLTAFETTGDYFFKPRLHTFNGVLDAFSKSASKEAPDRAREWLQQMITTKQCVSPDQISYNSALNAYASRGDARRATALFEEMKHQTKRGLQPDTYSYNMLMKAWQRSGSPKAPEATVQLLQDFKESYERQGKQNLFLRPNTSIYSIPMSLVNAEKAHHLLDEMLEWHKREPQSGMQPKTWHYAMVMNAYAKEGKPERSEEIFMRMLQLNREGHNHVQPNLQNFCILIKAWCKQRTPESLKRAEAILEQMEELFVHVEGVPSGEPMNTYGYNSVMNAHVQSGADGSAKRVEELFDRMTQLGREHNNPEMLPDKISYTTLMKAWVQEQAPGYAERVEQLLRQMSDAYEKDGIGALKPDVVSYGCAIDAWSRRGDATGIYRAEFLLRQMERLSEKGDKTLQPNDFCFNSIINAHSKAGNAEQAESVLHWMEESYRAGNRRAKPDTVTYTSCIDAWARVDTTDQDPVRKSQQMFDTMVERYKEGDVDFKPTAVTFTALMMVLANHNAPQVSRFARENLCTMEELDIAMNSIAYNALLHACSCAIAAKHDALELAITSFHTMKKKGIETDSYAYNSLLYVVNNLVEGEDERQRALEDVFNKCQQDDMVNDIILATMQRFGLPTSMKHLMSNRNATSNNKDESDVTRQ